MSSKQSVVFWLLFASISVACQARLLRMTNQLTSAAVANARYIGFDYLLATSVSNAQYILPSFCEQCEGEFVTIQIPNQPDLSAPPTPPFVSTILVISIEYDEANQLLLMTTVQPQVETDITCHSFNLLSNQAEDFSELITTGSGSIAPYYTLVDAVCVPYPETYSASTISSALAHPIVRGATSYAITAVISYPYTSLTLVAIANQSDPDNPPNNIQITSAFDLQFHSGSYVERVEVTSNSFSVDNQAPFVAVVYATDDGTVHTHLQQIDTSASPPAFDLHSYLDHLGPFPSLYGLQLATQPTSRTDWVVFILLSYYDGSYNSSLYSFTVTSCVSDSCPHTCSGTPCFIVNGGHSSPPNFIASWSSQQVPILSANKFSILDTVDASIVYTNTTTGNIVIWETDENGNFPVGPGDVPTSFLRLGQGSLLYDVANNNVGGFIVAYGEGAGFINIAIRCNSTTKFVNDVIYYDDIYGSEGFAAVTLSNSCNNGYVGAFAAAPVNEGGSVAIYSAL